MGASFKDRGAATWRTVGRGLLVLMAGLAVLAAGLAFNAWRQGSRQLDVPPVAPLAVDGAAAVARLGEAIRTRTIASPTDAQQNADQFRQLHALLAERYPKAQVRDFDGDPERLTEMDALIAYLQMLGTLVDFDSAAPLEELAEEKGR